MEQLVIIKIDNPKRNSFDSFLIMVIILIKKEPRTFCLSSRFWTTYAPKQESSRYYREHFHFLVGALEIVQISSQQRKAKTLYYMSFLLSISIIYPIFQLFSYTSVIFLFLQIYKFFFTLANISTINFCPFDLKEDGRGMMDICAETSVAAPHGLMCRCFTTEC